MQGNPHKTISRFFSTNFEGCKARYTQSAEGRRLPTKNTLSSSFHSELKERESFPEKQKLEFIATTLALQEKSQINNLTLHSKEIEEKQQVKPEVSKGKKIKIKVEIIEIQT